MYVASELIKNKKIKTKIKKNLSWERIESGDILLADVIPYAVKLLNETTKYMDFTRAFINLSYDEMSMHAWEWISGEGTDHYKRREIGISNNIAPNSALKAFLSLKKTLNQLGYNAIIILLDEFEAIELLQISLKQKLLNNIRHLIDTNPFGLSMIIACAPEVWRILLSEYHAFSERIIKEVNLKPMGKKHVEELISLYLDTARYDGGKGIKPFTKASIDNVYQMSQGNIRRIVSICGRILDVAVKQEKKLIDANCFREFQIPLNNKTIKNVL